MGTRHWPEDADEYVEELQEQLAKANERIAELEEVERKQSTMLEFYSNDYAAKQLDKEQEK